MMLSKAFCCCLHSATSGACTPGGQYPVSRRYVERVLSSSTDLKN